jgi:hypothetical protein
MPLVAHLLAQHPIAALVGVFSAGIGLGVLASAILGQFQESRWQRHRLPQSWHELGDRLRQVPETIAGHLPASITHR